MAPKREDRMIRLPLIFLTFFLLQCRADMADDDTRLVASHDWVNLYGESGSCEAPPETCTKVDNDKKFIEACVAAGFQAKTCGCSVKCSGLIDFKRPRPVDIQNAPADDTSACSMDDRSYLQQIKSTLGKTRELADCINGHVCLGHTIYCTQTDSEVSYHIRSLGKANCEAEVSAALCSSGRVDSWECPDPTVETLSREWTASFQEDDKPLRQCFQGLICNGDESRCSDSLRVRARSIKKALEDSRCRYWYESFCRLGSDTDL